MWKQFTSGWLLSGLLTFLSLNSCAVLEQQRAHSELEIAEDVTYLEDGNPRHRLDIFMPAQARNVPVVFFVHGGYWNSQDKNYYAALTGLYANIGIALAHRGIGVVVADYRIYPETQIAGELQDLTQALHWTQEHIWRYGGDPHRLVLAGHSAGGQMIAWLGLESRQLQAAGIETRWIRGLAPMSAILDINQMEASQDAAFNTSTTYPVFGRNPADWRLYSPASYFKAPLPPIWIAIGEKDYPYLWDQNQDARKKLDQLHAVAGFLALPGYRHEDLVLKFGQPGDPLMPALADFVFQVTR